MKGAPDLFTQAFHGPLESPPVKVVVVNEEVGRGLVATRNIKRGEIIFTESAAVSHQQDTGVPGCSYCLSSLAGVEASPSLGALPHKDCFPEPAEIVHCPECQEAYCGVRCLEHAKILFHQRLCCGRGQARVREFLREKDFDSYNVNVVSMVVKLVSMMVQEAERNGGDFVLASEPFCRWTSQRGMAEMVSIDMNELRGMLIQALSLTEKERAWVTVELVERCSAMICLNSIIIRMKSPFAEYFSTMRRRVSEAEKNLAVEEILKVTGGVSAQEADAYFHELCGVQGCCMFALHACCNHSCKPVAEVRGSGFFTHTIDVVATTDIYRGDPITITYVNPKLKWIQRCELLQKNYGFICACVACASEFCKKGDDEVGSASDETSESEDNSEDGDCDINPEEWASVEDALDAN